MAIRASSRVIRLSVRRLTALQKALMQKPATATPAVIQAGFMRVSLCRKKRSLDQHGKKGAMPVHWGLASFSIAEN